MKFFRKLSYLTVATAAICLALPQAASAASNTNYQTFTVMYPSGGVLTPYFLGVTSMLVMGVSKTPYTVSILNEDNSLSESNACGLPFKVSLMAGIIDYYSSTGSYLSTDSPSGTGSYLHDPCTYVSGKVASGLNNTFSISTYAVGRGNWVSSQTSPSTINLQVNISSW